MPLEPRDAQWRSKVQDSFHRQTFLRLLAADLEDLSPGRCSIVVGRRADLCQQHGFIHAGVTATLADTAAGYAAFSLMPAMSTVLTVEFKINLLAPAEGSALVAKAQVIRAGRTLTTVACEVVAKAGGYDEDVPVASFLGTMMCLQGKADSG